MAAIGFDVGAETCYVCMSKGVGFEVVDNDLSHRCSANVLFFNDQRRFFGHTADTSMFSNLNGSIKYVKNLIGLSFDDPFAQAEMGKSHCRFVKLENGEIGVKVMYLREETVFSVVQIYGMVLSHLKAVAQRHTEKRVSECVIAVPPFFSEHQRYRLFEASKIAGLRCLRILNDGSASSLTAAVFKADWTDMKKVAIVDVGSFNVTVTISDIKPFHAKVLSSSWSVTCGGSAIDRTMCQLMLERFQKKHKNITEIPNKARLKLLKQCMLTKKKISMAPKSTQTLQIECFIGDSVDLLDKINYADLESILSYFEEDLQSTIFRALERCKLSIDAIERVELIGGASRFPIYSAILEKIFNKPVSTGMNADETVAKGCGLMSGLHSPFVRMKKIEFEEVMQNSVVVRWVPMNDEKSSENNIFYPGLAIPCTRALMLHRQSDFDIEVNYQSDLHSHSECYRISGLSQFQGGECRVIIKFKMDANEFLTVAEAVAELPVAKKSASKSAEKSEQKDEEKPDEAEKSLETSKASPSVPTLTVTRVSGIRTDSSKANMEVAQLIETENQMLKQITEVEKKNEALNSLEEILFSSETEISGELRSYMSDVTVENIQKLTAEHWNWIETVKYDRSFTSDECHERQKALSDLIAPAKNRLNFFQVASSSVPQAEELFLKVKSFIDDYTMGADIYNHIEPKKIDFLEEKLNNSIQLISLVKNALSCKPDQIPDGQLPNIADVVTKLQQLDKLFAQAISTPKPQPTVNEPPPTQSEDIPPPAGETQEEAASENGQSQAESSV